MATAQSIKRDSAGSLTLFTITLSDVQNAGTYDSHIPEVVAWWMNLTDAPTQGKEGVVVKHQQDVSGQDNASRFTIYVGEANRYGDLCVLARA